MNSIFKKRSIFREFDEVKTEGKVLPSIMLTDKLFDKVDREFGIKSATTSL